VGFARWRVQEAYAQLSQAKVLWLPSLRAGFGFHRHDGNYQASSGEIVDVNRNSFNYGLGVGTVGAGTMLRPGILTEFHLADAIFLPKVAKTTAAARSFGSTAVVNEQMKMAAVAYLELLGAHQDARLIEETRQRTAELFKLTSDFAATGQGLQADADRMGTELTLVDSRLLAARERVDVAGARLAQTLSADSTSQIVPMDVTVLPIDLVSLQTDKSSLIQTGLSNRPELRESQALVAAACEQYRRQKFAPFVPSVLLGFSTGGFGGGLGNNLDNVDDRYDFDALLSWEVRNLGLGEHAIRREADAQIQQAKFEKIRVMDQVAREVAEAYSQVQFRSQQIRVTRDAIQTAENSYQRNLSRIRDGQGLPLEVLQSVRALEDAQRAYLNAVVDHNQAQFQLQWALGWPVSAPAPTDNSI
jgi:outer membrane protein TolC